MKDITIKWGAIGDGRHWDSGGSLHSGVGSDDGMSYTLNIIDILIVGA